VLFNGFLNGVMYAFSSSPCQELPELVAAISSLGPTGFSLRSFVSLLYSNQLCTTLARCAFEPLTFKNE